MSELIPLKFESFINLEDLNILKFLHSIAIIFFLYLPDYLNSYGNFFLKLKLGKILTFFLFILFWGFFWVIFLKEKAYCSSGQNWNIYIYLKLYLPNEEGYHSWYKFGAPLVINNKFILGAYLKNFQTFFNFITAHDDRFRPSVQWITVGFDRKYTLFTGSILEQIFFLSANFFDFLNTKEMRDLELHNFLIFIDIISQISGSKWFFIIF